MKNNQNYWGFYAIKKKFFFLCMYQYTHLALIHGEKLMQKQ